MKDELLNIVLGLTGFLLFSVIQAIVINGIKATFEEGMIFEKYGKWVDELGRIGKPLGSCIKCMGSVFGGLMYWPFVILVFDFNWWQVPLYIINVFILVSLNWYFYKKL